MARIRRVLRGQRVTVFLLYATGGLFVALAADGYWDGRCYNEVLSPDPMQCYALEQAESEDIMDVDAVYTAGDGLLYVFYETSVSVEEDEHVYIDGLRAHLMGFASDYAARHPNDGPFSGNENYLCSPLPSNIGTAADCAGEAAFNSWPPLIWPRFVQFDQIHLVDGGKDAREDFGGWATWTELWPTDRRGEGSQVARSVGGEGQTKFDISDVDFENIPDMADCAYALHQKSCGYANRHPDIPIAGRFTWGRSKYVYIKAEDLEDQELTEFEDYLIGAGVPPEQVTIGGDLQDGFVLLPADHSFKELWRYAVILDRFSKSSGNTLGIKGAIVDINFRYGGTYTEMNLLPGLSNVSRYGEDPKWGKGSRNFVVLDSNHDDLQRIRDALPVLLPQLGIPVDAVGRIVYAPR